MVTIFLKDLCERYIPFCFYLSLLYLFIYSYVLIEFKSMKYMQNLPIRFGYFNLAVYLVGLGED